MSCPFSGKGGDGICPFSGLTARDRPMSARGDYSSFLGAGGGGSCPVKTSGGFDLQVAVESQAEPIAMTNVPLFLNVDDFIRLVLLAPACKAFSNCDPSEFYLTIAGHGKPLGAMRKLEVAGVKNNDCLILTRKKTVEKQSSMRR
eukprot:tig00020610_g11998.t1